MNFIDRSIEEGHKEIDEARSSLDEFAADAFDAIHKLSKDKRDLRRALRWQEELLEEKDRELELALTEIDRLRKRLLVGR